MTKIKIVDFKELLKEAYEQGENDTYTEDRLIESATLYVENLSCTITDKQSEELIEAYRSGFLGKPLAEKKTKLKYFYIRADLGDGIPSYDFVVKATIFDVAEKLAKKILKKDYPEQWSWRDGIDFKCEDITAETLLNRLTVN